MAESAQRHDLSRDSRELISKSTENRMNVRGILVDAADGHTYLLGTGERVGGAQAERPTVWRVTGASYESLEKTRSASGTIRDQFHLATTLVPGLTHDEHVKQAVLEAITTFISKFFGKARW